MGKEVRQKIKKEVNNSARLIVCYVCVQFGGTLIKDDIGYRHEKCNSTLYKKGIIQVREKK